MGLSGEIRLGGKLFNAISYEVISSRNEHYLMKWMRETGIDKVMPKPEGESDAEYLLRLQAALVDTLQLPELLGGYLLPAGKAEKDWTPQMAAETAAYIAQVNNAEDRAEVHKLGLAVTFAFFRAGLASLRHSQSVLDSLTASPGSERAQPIEAGVAH